MTEKIKKLEEKKEKKDNRVFKVTEKGKEVWKIIAEIARAYKKADEEKGCMCDSCVREILDREKKASLKPNAA